MGTTHFYDQVLTIQFSLHYISSLPEKPVLKKKNDTDVRVLSFRDTTMIQSTALRGHPEPHFKWYQQPIRTCASSCKPDVRRWRRVPRQVINPSEHVRSRISSLYLPPAKSGYFFRCVAKNSHGQDDVVFSVHRIGKTSPPGRKDFLFYNQPDFHIIVCILQAPTNFVGGAVVLWLAC